MVRVRGAWLIAIAVSALVECSTEPTAPVPPLESIVFVDNCPEITRLSVFPRQTGVGSSIALEAFAESPENEDMAYEWSADNGKFAAPAAPETTYLCESAGDWKLTLLVSTPRGCHMPASVSVACEGLR